MSYSLAIHGGAGNIKRGSLSAELEAAYTEALHAALDAGEKVLASDGSAVDSIVAAITVLENNPLFNAGRGSVFTKKGVHEMDAAIMDGSDLSVGAIAGVRNIKNPITLAREVMLHSGHVFLSGKRASEFALKQHIAMEHDDYFYNKERYDQWIAIRDSDYYQLDHKDDNLKGTAENPDAKFGTVGAVALDSKGNLAAATSTGGMTNKRFGRIGDSPVIGSGTYANNETCAISCTGHGEYFLRSVVAYDISCLMEYKGLSLQEACDTVIQQKLKSRGGEGGLIALDKTGKAVFCFNSTGMYRARKNSTGDSEIAWYGM